MSCGYFYEIKRKSEDYEQRLEQQHRENSNLSEYSKDEEIWEVPEENFDNVYQQMNCNKEFIEDSEDVGNDDDDIKEISTETANFKQFENPTTIRLSLSSEQIALKTQSQKCENSVLKLLNTKQQTINKSINAETDVMKSMTSDNNTTTFNTTSIASVGGNKVQWKNLKLTNNNNNSANERLKQNNSPSQLFNFTIVPINVSDQGQKKTFEEELENFPEIKLTSFLSRKNSLKLTTTKTTGLKPSSGFYGQTTLKDCKMSSSCSNYEVNKHISENSNSPESLLDNVLSAASSVSVQSSSQSSNSLATDLDVQKMKQASKTREYPVHSLSFTTNIVAEDNTGVLRNQIPKLKIITAPDSPLNSQSMSVGKNISPSMLTISNISHSDSFETASNRSRSSSASPLRSLSPKVPSEASLYPDDLRCKICNELFKDPRSLNCLHSFCFQCIVNENFKEDASIPFWSQPNQTIQESTQKQQAINEFDYKGINSSNNSARSASTDIHTVRSNSDLSYLPLLQKRRSSFSFKRKKSSDRLQLKIKSENASTAVSQQTSNSAQRQQKESTRIIKCKLCQFPTEVPVGGIRQLPQNFLLVRRIEEIRFKVGEEVLTKISCSLCCEETNATHHCLTCILNLCILCKESHERQKCTTQHNIKNIIELRRARREKTAQFIDNSKFVLKCSLHPGFDINSFCTICLQVACSDCLILLHKGHKHETIAKSIHYFGRILRDSTEQTRPMCNYAEHSIEKLNDIAKSINRKCDEIQTEVVEFMTRYFEALEAHKNTLLQQVHRARESKIEMILEQQIDLEKRTQDALMAIKFSQELQDIASDVEILAFIKILLKRFEYCQQFKAPIDPKILDTLHFLPKITAPAAKNQNDIELYGIITMQTVEPSLCSLVWDGVSQLRLHKKAELVLISRDAEGASLWHGGLQIKCRIKYKDNNVKSLPIEVTDNRDGSYIISFTPDSQGTLILTITINDKPIKGSPFSFQARTLRPHSGIYHCCAFCSSKGNKSVKCACDGRMPGFNGCGHGHTGHPGRRHWSCCAFIFNSIETNAKSVFGSLSKSTSDLTITPNRYQAVTDAMPTETTTTASPQSNRDISIGPCTWVIDRKCPDNDITFYLYTRKNPNDRQYLQIDGNLNDSNLTNSYYDSKHPSKIIIHGYNSDMFLHPLQMMKMEYLAKGDYNVFYVDWSKLAPGPCYMSAVHNTKHTGTCVAQLVERILDLGSTDIHVIGFSLGAQLANYIAKNLNTFQLPRITGLDPAMPLFITASEKDKLDSTDAVYVDVIHTNAMVQGKLERCGHADFYMNGGIVQPGCSRDNFLNPFACSHQRATTYFLESIRSPKGFWGWACSSYIAYLLGMCPPTNYLVEVGENTKRTTRGMFLVETNDTAPYALGKWTDLPMLGIKKPSRAIMTFRPPSQKGDPLMRNIDEWAKLDYNFNNIQHQEPTPFSQDPYGDNWTYFSSDTSDITNNLNANSVEEQDFGEYQKGEQTATTHLQYHWHDYKRNLTEGFIDNSIFKIPEVGRK